MSSAAKDHSAMKKAAAFLLRGGTLTSEQCESCGGPLVKFEGKMMCANCGWQKDAESQGPAEKPSPRAAGTSRSSHAPQPRLAPAGFEEAIRAIEQKIQELCLEAREVHDTASLREKGELLMLYLEVLGKIREFYA